MPAIHKTFKSATYEPSRNGFVCIVHNVAAHYSDKELANAFCAGYADYQFGIGFSCERFATEATKQAYGEGYYYNYYAQHSQ